MNKIIFITGPTATGKTEVSLKLAEENPNKFEIINFDSLLFYRELNIGTAKPSSKEMALVPHHLINNRSIKRPMDAAQFVDLANPIIKDIFKRKKIPLLTGGSGFYLRALVKGMLESQSIPDEVRSESENKLQKSGIHFFREYLQKHDPESFKDLHENDHYRIIRAYEHHLVTGKKISKDKQKMDENNPYDFSQNVHQDWNFTNIYLDIPKDDHYNIMETRAKNMVEAGLINEVESLLKDGFSSELKPMQSIGYKETISYIQGEIETQKELIERIFISTRQLAKSQRTFFKKVTPKQTFDTTREMDDILSCAASFL